MIQRHRNRLLDIEKNDITYKGFLNNNTIYILPIESTNKPIKFIFEEENNMTDTWVFLDRPVVEKELNGTKILLYEAWGIPKNMITYSTEFINKTKEVYLNISGKYEKQEIGFENDINVHLKIDTRIYDGYEVDIRDGLITVTLHEIENEEPILIDYGKVS